MESSAKKKLEKAKLEKFRKDRKGHVNVLLDFFIERMGLKNDAALCRLLKVAPSAISKLRHGVLFPGASIVLDMHEKSGIPVEAIREILDVPPEYKF